MSVYRYPFVESEDGGILRPFLPIQIYNPHTKITLETYCLADTGADATLLPRWIAISTGHNLDGNGVEDNISQGIEGKDVVTWKHTFILKLLDSTSSNVLWQSNEQLIDCAEHDNVPPLLGSTNFLSNFKITFDYPNNCCIVEF